MSVKEREEARKEVFHMFILLLLLFHMFIFHFLVELNVTILINLINSNLMIIEVMVLKLVTYPDESDLSSYYRFSNMWSAYFMFQ